MSSSLPSVARPTGARSRMRATSRLAVLAALVLFAPAVPAQAQPGSGGSDLRWPAHAELQAKPGNDRTIGEGRLFIPAWQDRDSLLFLDLRGMGDSRSNAEGNFGLAFRQLIRESWIVGGYGFFDYRHSGQAANNDFIGGVIGAEAMSADWDLRANFHIPESGSQAAPGAARAVLAGPNLVVQNGREKALYGIEGEIGMRLPFIPDDSIFWDTRLFAGGYHFDASGVRNVSGPRGRFETRLHDLPYLPRGSRLTLGAEVQWDDPRGTQVFGVIRLRVPFWGYGGSPPDGATAQGRLARRMTDPIQRDVDLLSGIARSGGSTALNPKTGRPITGVYFAEQDGMGDGSRRDPDSLADAIAAAGVDGVVSTLR